MALDVASGNLSDSPDGLQPYDPGSSPGTAPPTAIVAGQLSGPTVPGRAYDYASQVAGDEAAITAAQSAGMRARESMLAHYAADVLPVGAAYGDPLPVVPVPEDATSPVSGFLYPQGDQPGA